MRVLIVSQYFWPEHFLINDLAVGLQQYGHQVAVLTGLPNYPGGRIYPGCHLGAASRNYQGVDIIRVPLVPRGRGTSLRLFLNYVSFALSASLLGPWKYRAQPDRIIVFQPSPVTVGIPAVVLSKLRRSPIYFWVQDLWPDCLISGGGIRAPWIIRAVDWLVKTIYRHCHLLLVQSEGFANYIQDQGVPREKIVLMPNWADAVFRPITLPLDAPEHRQFPHGFRVLFAGNVGQSQSWPTWVEAAAYTRHRPDIHWIVMGDGRQYQALARRVQEKQLHGTFHLLDRCPPEVVPRYFAAADALLVTLRHCPTLARTIPSKVQAYLACGRPVVAGLEGDGARVIRQAEAGIVVPPDDAQALAHAVLQLADLPVQQRLEMGKRGRAYYEAHFARERLLERWHQLLLEGPQSNANSSCLQRRSSRCAA